MTVENDLIYRDWPDFSDGVEITLVFLSRIEIYPVMMRGSKWTCFCAWVEIDFVFVWGPKLLGCDVWIESDMVLVLGQQVTCFQCGDRWPCFFCVGGRS